MANGEGMVILRNDDQFNIMVGSSSNSLQVGSMPVVVCKLLLLKSHG